MAFTVRRMAANTSTFVNGSNETYQIIQLRRLLHCIAKTNSDAEIPILHLIARIDLASQLLNQIKSRLDCNENTAILMADLQSSVHRACAMTYSEISRRSATRNNGQGNDTSSVQSSQHGVLHDIFFSDKTEPPLTITNKRFQFQPQLREEEEEEKHESPLISRLPESTATTATQPAQVFATMEEALEDEIAEMAHQLKLSTITVNDTLRSQTTVRQCICHLEYI